VGGEVVLPREPADVADLAEEGGSQHRPEAEELDRLVLDSVTAASMRASTVAMR
jgi:hypothetical protein